MSRIVKITLFITNLLMGLVLSRFAISKLTGWDISVKAFIEMAKPLGIDPTFFRVFTGVIILFIFLGYLVTSLFTLLENKMQDKQKMSYILFVKLTNLAGLLTMGGALLAEYFLRVEPKLLLVYIAIGVIVFSSINLYIIQNKLIIKKTTT